MPARNAPIVAERPARCPANAVPSASNRTVSRKRSAEFVRATHVSQVRKTGWQTNAATPSAIAAIASWRSAPSGSGPPLSCHPPSTTRNGRTARSWKSRIPSTRRPGWLLTSPWSTNCLRVMAVDDIATAPPSNTAVGRPIPPSMASPATIKTVKPTCRLPAPKTSRRAAIIAESENSRPTMNIRKMMPSSAKNLVSSLVAISCKPCGPITKPANR